MLGNKEKGTDCCEVVRELTRSGHLTESKQGIRKRPFWSCQEKAGSHTHLDIRQSGGIVRAYCEYMALGIIFVQPVVEIVILKRKQERRRLNVQPGQDSSEG